MKVVASGRPKGEFLAFLEHIGAPLLGLLACALFTGLFFTDLTNYGSLSTYGFATFSCSINGDVVFPWSPAPDIYWSPGSFLSITLGFGSLNFTQAKAIDVVWDFVVGRGGQLLLTVLAYPAIRKSMMTSLEWKTMPMPLLASLTFRHGSINAWWCVFSNLMKRWSWRLLGYLYVIVYLLAFGTLVSAMTGYQGESSPFYKEEGTDNLVSYDKVNATSAVVLIDGPRVGLPSNTTILDADSDPNQPLYFYSEVVSDYCGSNRVYLETNNTNGTLTWANDGYHKSEASQMGNASINASTTFAIDWVVNKTRMEPYRPSSIGYAWVDCTTSNLTLGDHNFVLSEPVLSFSPYEGPSDIGSPLAYLDHNGNLLDPSWLKSNGVSVCLPQGTYQWGFSSLLLFTFCMATITYVGVLLALHIDIWWNSQVDRTKLGFSLYRDIMDFAGGIKTQLGEKAEDLPAKDLDKAVKAYPSGVQLSTYACPPSRAQVLGRRYRRYRAQVRVNHACSMAETKRALGLSYGPVRKYSSVEMEIEEGH